MIFEVKPIQSSGDAKGRPFQGKRLRSGYRVTWGLILVVVFLAACQGDMDSQMAARVNGEPIGLTEVMAGAGIPGSEMPLPPEKATVVRVALERMVEDALILQEAKRLGVTVSNPELDRQMALVQEDFPGDSFRETLVREYIDPKEWREKLRRSLVIKKTTDLALSSRLNVDPEEWAAFFQAEINRLPSIGRCLVRHITVDTSEEAARVLDALKKGADFDTVLMGELPEESEPLNPVWVYPQNLPQEMGRAVEETPIGALSRVVESDYGYSIFWVLDKEKKTDLNPEDLLIRIRRRYKERKRAEAFVGWIKELKAQARIEINPSLSVQLEKAPVR